MMLSVIVLKSCRAVSLFPHFPERQSFLCSDKVVDLLNKVSFCAGVAIGVRMILFGQQAFKLTVLFN
nr:hypothetical protein [Paenibacillus sp. sptzw28]